MPRPVLPLTVLSPGASRKGKSFLIRGGDGGEDGGGGDPGDGGADGDAGDGGDASPLAGKTCVFVELDGITPHLDNQAGR